MKWNAISKSTPTSGGSTNITIYPEEYGIVGTEVVLYDAWCEVQSGRAYQDPRLWLKRHPGVWVEMFRLPSPSSEIRFRLVAFSQEGKEVYLGSFAEWNGPVIEQVVELNSGSIGPLTIRNRELLG